MGDLDDSSRLALFGGKTPRKPIKDDSEEIKKKEEEERKKKKKEEEERKRKEEESRKNDVSVDDILDLNLDLDLTSETVDLEDLDGEY